MNRRKLLLGAGALAVAPSVQLAVNLKTARALGITIPQSILLRATRLIE